MKTTLILLTLLVMSQISMADTEAGKTKSTVCSACHGVNGISVSDDIPNLAGQKSKYLAAQLQSFRSEKRKNPLMNAIAAQLSDTDIEDLTSFFSSLPPAAETVTGQLTTTLGSKRIEFPHNYKTDFSFYTTVNRPDNKQVRYLYANKDAVEGAKTGGPLPDGSVVILEIYKAQLDTEQNPVQGDDGFYKKDKLAAYTVMEKRAGWGDDIPETLRNGDWNYAVFTPEKRQKEGVNQAKCLACHKPLKDADYLFSAEALKTAKN